LTKPNHAITIGDVTAIANNADQLIEIIQNIKSNMGQVTGETEPKVNVINNLVIQNQKESMMSDLKSAVVDSEKVIDD
jgi:hypothetical protein